MQLTFTEPLSSKCPIAYIGAKKNLYTRVMDMLPNGTTELVSPFCGGGSLELKIAASGIRVKAYDLHPPIATFYTAFNGQSHEVSDRAHTLDRELASEDLARYAQDNGKAWMDIDDPVTQAAVFWICAKNSFNGMGMTTTLYKRRASDYYIRPEWRNWRNPNFSCGNQTWADTLKQHPDSILYCDPPYVKKSTIYGFKGGQPEFEHEAFRDALAAHRGAWICSYGPHPLIEELYADFNIRHLQWHFSSRNQSGDGNLLGDELLISNF